MSTSFKLYGYPWSASTRRVALIAKERNIPYELVPVDVRRGEHMAPSFAAHQPFNQVPYVVLDDGFELYESRAICRYLATLGSGPALIPTEPRAIAKFEQACSIEYAQWDPIVSTIGDEMSEPFSSLENKLDVYEAILSKQKYLAGDELTLADLFHLPQGSTIFDLRLGSLDKRPHLKRWWDDLCARPAWQAVKGPKGLGMSLHNHT